MDPALTTRPLAMPEVAAPEAIAAAVATREQRRQDFRRASQAVREATAGQAEADRLDLLATADARDRGEADPVPVNQERARRALGQASADLRVEELRLERAHQALVEAVAAHAEQWAQAASQARAKADAKAAKALQALRQAEQERTELRRVGAWLERLSAGESFDRLARKGAALVGADTAVPDSRNIGRQLSAAELMDALGAYVADTTEQADQRRSTERASQEAADDQAREEVRAFRELHPGVGG
jgi:hypothetical protein